MTPAVGQASSLSGQCATGSGAGFISSNLTTRRRTGWKPVLRQDKDVRHAPRDPLAEAEAALRDFGLSYPDTTEDFPWEHRALKVKGKVFAFLVRHPDRLDITLKLPVSGPAALALPLAEPTGYGMGKHGWVTLKFPAGTAPPLDTLREWVDESFRAVAPKGVLAKLDKAKGDEIVTYVKPKAKPKKRAK